MEEPNGTSTGCLSASFRSERDCLAAFEEMREVGATKRWEKDLTFKFTGGSIEQIKQSAIDMYNRLKPFAGFKDAELDLHHKVVLDH